VTAVHHHNDTKIAVIVDEVADGRDIPTRGPVPVVVVARAACDCGPWWYCADPENCRRVDVCAAAMRKRAA
jgi:hypothetical protein